MKVLRVYWILKTYKGTHENRKADRLEHRYKSEQKQTDFDRNTPIKEAYESIFSEFGKHRVGEHLVTNASVVPRFAEIISNKIVEIVELKREPVDTEKMLQDPLFDGITWSGTFGKSPAKN